MTYLILGNYCPYYTWPVYFCFEFITGYFWFSSIRGSKEFVWID